MSDSEKDKEIKPVKKRRKPKAKPDSEVQQGEAIPMESGEVILDGGSDAGNFGVILPKGEYLPEQLGVIAVQHRPLFPHMVIPLVVEGDIYQQTLLEAQKGLGYVGIFLSTAAFDSEKPKVAALHKYGVVARIAKVFSQDNHGSQVLLDVLERIHIVEALPSKDIMRARVEYIHQIRPKVNDEIRAYSREILSNMKELIRLNPLIKEELNQFISQISMDDPSRLADFASTLTSADKEELQQILATIPIVDRLGKTLLLIKKELELSRLQAEISQRIEDRISEHQREFFLREQLKEIQKELGLSKDEKTQIIEKLQQRAKKLSFSQEVKERFDEEMGKLAILDVQSPEFNVSRNYLEWIVGLPWGVYSKDNLDIVRAEKILEADHYGLEDIKERIIEFIASMALRKENAGTILCFVGPPGVGKTSIGKSIARAMGRKFFRFSVGGMKDEAEIKGHRRTYIGAMPGKFIQALKGAKFANPVIMLDEIDKIGNSFQGDPASALLEVLDPEQNGSFSDHYLDLPFDLSKVFFITTANQLDTIPPALLDRMEVLRLSGYIAAEKMHIAKKYLIPKQRKAHGLTGEQLAFADPAIRAVIDGYAREAGVRKLENMIQKICRKRATEIVRGSKLEGSRIGLAEVKKYLKNPIFEDDEIHGEGRSGVATGLAWTSMGGSILSLEANWVASAAKSFQQTGQLGEVMVESSKIAYSFVMANAARYGGDQNFFDNKAVHLHVPAGATPKDGPSAGVTMASVLISLMLDQPLIPKLGMTGELTLIGEVLPIGGLKEKMIAARRSGLKTIIVPAANKKDYLELPDHLKEKLEVHFASTYDDVFKVAFGRKPVFPRHNRRQTDHAEAPTGPPAKGGGKSKLAGPIPLVAQLEVQPKRKPGRPKKSAAPTAPKGKLRKPGRPKKVDLASPLTGNLPSEETAQPPVGRKPGRPRKSEVSTQLTLTGAEKPQSPVKRKPGRPKKTAPTATILGEKKTGTRKPGRPKKAEQPVASKGKPKKDTAGQPKRKPGRPKKS
ncbi:MAG: endopeptidase La [Candidatus Lambdaproteobacteria bacterium RIFOXYD1_FULL_56_27]|uniref:Lon protease n=1 Tax=Candidatus Lambdaproteobacteria bacterium RIFOXYD2_FULL_56_26 TaxID=1817773 RepID=A0A1F6H042_9PROT|nr:MAG: endopeptidase La [Candidatus Lambdaproteobacteria bacterium RIFOXYC1_FULL_56_13]OGH03777.1 MAG: endopeptidase La [Candidatus Lambdaproteobacteria bacterium RIFOXYD2_FULL_56_26]OGH08772.1 MAG: endopeptidase La [Candidatus Lambdaproteobacteria bacterium RIFOXYD1_FULL_56_27]